MTQKTLGEIELALRTGRGIAVICEGETSREDEFIFSRWFADRSLELTFFCQDGWKRVVDAVTGLRGAAAVVPVFGLCDRDFSAAADIVVQTDQAFAGHVYRLPRYDIESYLLDADGWLAVLRHLHMRSGGPPAGWDTAQAIQARIEQIHRQAIPIAAHNWVVRDLDDAHHQDASFAPRDYLGGLAALAALPNLATVLDGWAQRFGVGTQAQQLYEQRLTQLTAMSSSELVAYVSGKLVLRELRQALPRPRGHHAQHTVEDLVDDYLDRHDTVPTEIGNLIGCILQRGRAELAGRAPAA
jgi:hypothetical protein